MMVGREKEKERLLQASKSTEAEFLVVYGRRRVGKTYLVRETFRNNFDFYLTGLYNEPKQVQLKNFSLALADATGSKRPIPRTWLEAFRALKEMLKERMLHKKGKAVVFIDELPWLDTPRSGFLAAFEGFWNSWGSAQKDLLLIVCGSATSWIIKKVFRNKGGLYNRTTGRIYLEPFTLRETEQYLTSRGFAWSRYDIAECYMIMGGIPYYLRQLDANLPLATNIDRIFFDDGGKLSDEFDLLYDTLFNNSKNYIRIVETLSGKKKGMTRQEIIARSKLPDNGSTSELIEDLYSCRMISKHNEFGKRKREIVYRLSDYYSLFYLRFIKGNYGGDPQFWTHAMDNPSRRAWSGYSFEQLCMDHIDAVKKKLGIAGILTQYSTWSGSDGESSSQIDLLIDRRDRVIDICEIKFSLGEFTIDKEYDRQLRSKISVFRNAVRTKKALHLVMVTTFGLKKNKYSSLAQGEVVLDDLFD